LKNWKYHYIILMFYLKLLFHIRGHTVICIKYATWKWFHWIIATDIILQAFANAPYTNIERIHILNSLSLMVLCIPQKYFASMQTNILEKTKIWISFLHFYFIHFWSRKEVKWQLENTLSWKWGRYSHHILFHLHENAFESKKGHH
jgi:hypothetical protein